MDLKFTFSGSPSAQHDHDGAPAAMQLPFSTTAVGSPQSTSSVLELRVSLTPDGGEIVCEGISGDGVSYAKSSKQLSAGAAQASAAQAEPQGVDVAVATSKLAAAVRAGVARAGAELPEPLIQSVTAIELDLGGREAEVLTELGVVVSTGTQQLGQVDGALQARTGVAAGTPIRKAS
ncbi:MAG: hypothetical protein GX862_03210 [Leucobacter sp.]|nr:hypothetical protein [Leucobacter sp.]